MRFLFGRGWVYCDETNGDGDAKGTAGGGAADDALAGDGDVQGDGEDSDLDGGGEARRDGAAAGGDKEKKAEAPKDMKAALDMALGYKKGANGEDLDPLTGAPKKALAAKAGDPKAAAAAAAAGAAKDTETHWANGKPKKDAQGNDLNDAGAVTKKAEASKPKTAAELDLKPEQKKLLTADTRIRFGELINTLKTHEGTITKQGDQIKNLTEGRDTILNLMKDARCSDDDLAGYLYLNTLLTSDNPLDLETALKEIESERMNLYARLGREPEGGGVDLLKGFPDLQKQVEDEEITRKAALEMAHARREKAARTAGERRQQQQDKTSKDTADQAKKASDDALNAIDAWCEGIAKSDIDYQAKKDKLLAKVDGVIKNYPAAQWLPTLKLLYEGIEMQKAPAGGRHNQPLRPSGAKAGAPAPATMKEAIDRGLGYAAEQK